MSERECDSRVARRYGSAACDLPLGHDGLHTQHVTGISWTTERARESWLEDDA
jgi:hypothetical protein